MHNLSIKQRLIIILSFLTLFITFIIVVIITSRQSTPLPIITSHSYQSPTTAQEESIILIFNTQIVAQDFIMTSEPAESWQINNISTNSISLIAQAPLLSNSAYTLNLSWQNKQIAPLIITIPQSNANYRNNYLLQQESDQEYPLAKITPYKTPAFRVVYLSPMTLEITLKSYSLSESEAISQVKSWVSKNGGDSGAHKYEVIAPSPTSTPISIPDPTAAEENPLE